MRIFKCANGLEYECPDTACVFCDHCQVIFYDYTHGPYLMFCDLPDHDCHDGAGCEFFTEEKTNDEC